MKNAMTRKIKTIDGDKYALNAADFSTFVERVPNAWLIKRKMERTPFIAVAKTLANHCEYTNGTKVDVTVKFLHEVTGCHKSTIKKVLDLLVECGALEVIPGAIKRPNGGSASDSRRFRKSAKVVEVWERNDIHYMEKEARESMKIAKQGSPVTTGAIAESKSESSPVTPAEATVTTVGSTVTTAHATVTTAGVYSDHNNTNTSITLNEKTSLREGPQEELDEEVELDSALVDEALASWPQLVPESVDEPKAPDPTVNELLADIEDSAPVVDHLTHIRQMANL